MFSRGFGAAIGVPAMGAMGLVAIILGACGTPGVGNTAGGASAFGSTLDGRALYAANCARCHGADLRGTKEGPPFLDAIYRPGHHADASFLIAVRSGARAHHWNFGPMLPVPGLSDQQVAAIVAFVRAEQQAAGIR